MEEYLESYREAWRRRRIDEEDRRRELAKRAFRQAEALTDVLKNKYQCQEVYLIGSLARHEFGEHSDIDLVVGGLRAEHYYRALGEISSLSSFPVDLVPLEAANDLIKESIAAEGIRMYPNP